MALDVTEETWGADRHSVTPVFRLLPSLWGVAVVLGLFAYSIHNAIDAAPTSASRAAEPIVTTPPRSLSSSSSPASTLPTFTPTTMVVLLTCDGEEDAIAVYDGHIPVNYVVLAKDADRDVIVEFLAGRSTKFRPDARTQQTACFQRALENGEFP